MTNMREAVAKVRGALASKDIVQELTHYLVRGGFIYAQNGRMTACAPVDDTRTYLVPGDDFERALNLAKGDVVIEMVETGIRVKSGRYRATIQTLDPDLAALPDLPDEWRPVPELFIKALTIVRPFISDNATQPWALSVGIDKGALYATNNVSLVVVECDGLDDVDVLLPSWAADFLLERKEVPTEMHLSAACAFFRWPDGSWLRTVLSVGEFPPAAKTMLASSPEATWEITPELREAFKRAASLSETDIRISNDRITGGQGKTAFEEELTSNVPSPNSGPSAWHPKFLGIVFDAATHIDLSAWPRPATFSGPNVRGLIAGRT